MIITSGLPRKPGQTRLELAQVNVNILKDITPQIVRVAPKAIYILVSNPVDVLTYVFHKISGLPEHQIIGSGTILDTSRLQSALAKRFSSARRMCMRMSTASMAILRLCPGLWCISQTITLTSTSSSLPDGERITWKGAEEYEAIEQFVKTSGGQVIKAKGATFYAVAMSVCHLCKCVMSTAGTALTVSTMMHGEYGVDDVPCRRWRWSTTPACAARFSTSSPTRETARLQNSANKLKEVIHQITY